MASLRVCARTLGLSLCCAPLLSPLCHLTTSAVPATLCPQGVCGVCVGPPLTCPHVCVIVFAGRACSRITTNDNARGNSTVKAKEKSTPPLGANGNVTHATESAQQGHSYGNGELATGWRCFSRQTCQTRTRPCPGENCLIWSVLAGSSGRPARRTPGTWSTQQALHTHGNNNDTP